MPKCHIMTLGQHDRNSGSASTGMVGQHDPESLYCERQAIFKYTNILEEWEVGLCWR